MKYLLRLSFLLSILLVLCGCGGGGQTSDLAGAPAGTPPGETQDPPAPANAADNWQFSTTSTEGFPSIKIAGGFDESAAPPSGVVHVDGSACFDHLAPVGLTGVLNGSSLSLSSSPIAGQVITTNGSIMKDPLTDLAKFTGTYSIQGGCADGDKGTITGVEEPSMGGSWAGDFTSNAGNINRLTVTLSQGSVTSEGAFDISGTAGFETGTCFKSASITSGKFPSGSYTMGQAVSLEIQTDNGEISFVGTAEGDGLVRGNYTIAGGTCDPKGTAYLSPWEY